MSSSTKLSSIKHSSVKVSAIMLAAGQSKRFEGIKQLADINGQPMLAHSLDQLTGNGSLIAAFHEFAVILGANASFILPIMPNYVTPLVFDDWHKGMGASLAFALKNISKESSHILITLADQVAIGREQLEAMLQHCAASPDKIIAARYNEILGAPVIFPKAYFSLLLELDNDTGARKILQQHKSAVVAIDMPSAQYDIDTQLALEQWSRSNMGINLADT